MCASGLLFYIVVNYLFMRYLSAALLCIAIIPSVVFAQNEKDILMAKGEWLRARAMATTRPDVAISILRDCIKLDPVSIIYPLEIAFIHFRNKELNKAIEKLETLRYHKQVNASVYQLLARSYFNADKESRGVETLEKGLALFPESPLLCSEAGDYYLSKSDTARALRCFEKGMMGKKDALSCYYSAAILHATQKNYPVALALAEIAMNMDVSGKYRRPLSNLYFYCSRYLFRTGKELSATRDSILNTVAQHHAITALDTLCQHMLVTTMPDDIYQHDPRNQALIDGRNQIRQAGHAEAYLYWLMQNGDKDGFINWRNDNVEKWDAFVIWFRKRPSVQW